LDDSGEQTISADDENYVKYSCGRLGRMFVNCFEDDFVFEVSDYYETDFENTIMEPITEAQRKEVISNCGLECDVGCFAKDGFSTYVPPDAPTDAPNAPTPSGPTPSGPTPSGPTPSGPTPSGPTPSGPTPSGPTTEAPSSDGVTSGGSRIGGSVGLLMTLMMMMIVMT